MFYAIPKIMALNKRARKFHCTVSFCSSISGNKKENCFIIYSLSIALTHSIWFNIKTIISLSYLRDFFQNYFYISRKKEHLSASQRLIIFYYFCFCCMRTNKKRFFSSFLNFFFRHDSSVGKKIRLKWVCQWDNKALFYGLTILCICMLCKIFWLMMWYMTLLGIILWMNEI